MSDEKTNNQQTEERPSISKAGIVYGDMIYWITIVATFIVLIGSVMTFTMTEGNYLAPSYMLSAIWQGTKVDDIWIGAVGAPPNGHWYMEHLTSGNGITAFGIALGVFSVIPAIFASAYYLYKDKEKFYAVLGAIGGLITILAMMGIFNA